MKWRRQSFCLLSGSEEYDDNCWKWSAYVSIELSGEYSRFMLEIYYFALEIVGYRK